MNKIKLLFSIFTFLFITSTAFADLQDDLLESFRKIQSANLLQQNGINISQEDLITEFKSLLKNLPANIDVLEKHLPISDSYDANIVGLIPGGSDIEIVSQQLFIDGNYLAVEILTNQENKNLNLRPDLVKNNEERIEFFSQLKNDTEKSNLFIVFSKQELNELYPDRLLSNNGTLKIDDRENHFLKLTNRKYLMLEPKVEVTKNPLITVADTIKEKVENIKLDDGNIIDEITSSGIMESVFEGLKNLAVDELDYVRNHLNLLKDNSGNLSAVISRGCSHFMELSSDYQLHEWGTFIRSQISTSDNPLNSFLKPQNIIDMPKVCPSYPQMDQEAKAKVWSWVFLSMANAESSCRTDVTVQGVNDKAVGLLQIPQSRTFRIGSGGDICGNVTPIDPKGNLTCGLYMLGNQLVNYHQLFLSQTDRKAGKKSYWAVLMSHQQKVINGIKFYKPCFE